jgi:hypothetical protein
MCGWVSARESRASRTGAAAPLTSPPASAVPPEDAAVQSWDGRYTSTILTAQVLPYHRQRYVLHRGRYSEGSTVGCGWD